MSNSQIDTPALTSSCCPDTSGTPTAPKVTIGLPVFNGENYLAIAIDSVLQQTFTDLELVICDNASTDRTAEICADYSARDARVRVLRNERNLGAAANYNRVYEAARGRYFKWEAHDDALLPDYLQRCVQAMEQDPDAVICNGAVQYINEHGEVFGVYDGRFEGADDPDPAVRFATMALKSHPCNDFFGLIRREAMQGSLLHGTYHGADRAFIAQMAIRGKLLHLHEPLLQMREHPHRYTRSRMKPEQRHAWHAGDGAKRSALPSLQMYHEYRAMVEQETLTPDQRKRCRSVLRRWWIHNYNSARVAVDALAQIDPRIISLAEGIKYRLFGPPAGPLETSTRDASSSPGH